MACAYTAGELSSLYYSKETTYGTTVAAMTAALLSTSWQRQDDKQRFRQYLPGSRSYDVNSSVDQGNDVAFSLAGVLRNNAAWAEPLISGAFGTGAAGNTVESTDLLVLPSYSMLLRLGSTVKGNLAEVLYNGCKVNSLTLNADSPRAVITASAVVFAQFAEKLATEKKVSALQNLTLTVPDDPVATRPAAIQWSSGITIGTEIVYPVSWSLQVENNLGRTVGIAKGYDTKDYVVTKCLAEGQRSITLSTVLWFNDYKQIVDQLDNNIIGSVTIPISNAKSIKLTNCRYTLSLPEHVQDRHQITLNLDCAAASVV